MLLTLLPAIAVTEREIPSNPNNPWAHKKQAAPREERGEPGSMPPSTKRLKAQAIEESTMAVSGDYEYELYEYLVGGKSVWGAAILEYWGSSSSVAIPSVLGGYPVMEISYGAFSYCVGLQGITIPNSVIYIAPFAFEFCSGISSITIPNSVTHIGWEAFAGCYNLKNITIPASVVFIGEDAFAGTPWFAAQSSTYVVVGGGVLIKFNGTGTSAVVPGNVRHIADAFSWNTSLTSITIPSGVTSIGDLAFAGCTRLTSISIPNSVTDIGWAAFYQCYELQGVTLPNSLTYVADSLFANSGLTSVTIPGSVKSVGESAFYKCSALQSVSIQFGVEYIGNEAFSQCFNLTSVSIPSSVEAVGSRAFMDTLWRLNQTADFVIVGSGVLLKYNGTNSTVTIPSHVTYISDAFSHNYHGIASVSIPSSVKVIDDYAFSNCYNLITVNIPSNVYYIGRQAFDYTGLKSLLIPESVRFIGEMAFYHCSSLESATIASGDLFIGSRAFAYCYDLIEVYFKDAPPFLDQGWESDDGVFYRTHSSLTLYYPASLATYWAPKGETKWYGYRIAPYTPPTPVPTPEPTPWPTLRPDGSVDYGDVKCSGKVSAADAACILRYLVRLEALGGLCLANADANGDGIVNAADAALILRFLVRLEAKLGPK